MASSGEVQRLRSLTGYVEADPYDDQQLSDLIDALGINRVAAMIWQQKAAQYASLVDTSESGSSRSMSQLHKNALTMAANFTKAAQDDETPVDEGRFARSRAAVREG